MHKRKLPRMQLKADVEIIHNDIIIKGEIDNLSLTGIFVKTSEYIENNTDVEVVIFLGKLEKQVSIQLKGKINRTGKKGIGIQFTDSEINKKLSKAFI